MKKTKTIIKELAIMFLVIVAIVLILEIILYSYSPTGKIVPNKISYSTPENISEEIASSTDTGTTPVTITYELDETNINNSKKNGSYDSGKQNPFAKPKTETATTEDEASESTNENSNNTTSQTNSSSTGSSSNSTTNNTTSYLPQTGTK